MKNPHAFKYRTTVEVSLDIIMLGESQQIIENDVDEANDKDMKTKGGDGSSTARGLQGLNNNYKSKNLRYVTFFNNFFKYPLYGILSKDFSFKVFINQEFQSPENAHNLKDLLMTVMEYTDEMVRDEVDADNDDEGKELKLILYLKRKLFESESRLLLKNLNWLGGVLVQNDDQDINKYDDWFIFQFEL